MPSAHATLTTYRGLPAHHLRAQDGAEALVSHHGGHVLAWKAAGGTREWMYLSPRSAIGPGQAIRGGVPVIFPQFSTRGPGPRHGFARTQAWHRVDAPSDAPDAAEGAAVLRLGLQDSPDSRAAWNHPFALELEVRVQGASLTMALSCRNTGAMPMAFACALHTYLAVHDVATVALEGLEGLPYEDNADAGRACRQAAAPLTIVGEVDRVYGAVPGPLVLHEGQVPTLRITQQGFEDVVVWNPGAVRCAALADMPSDGWRQMLCVEAARIYRPVQLAPGGAWAGVQQLTVLR